MSARYRRNGYYYDNDYNFKKWMAFIYGAIIGLTMVLYIEGMLSIFFTAFAMSVIVAPMIEEFFKTQVVHFDNPYTRYNVVGYVFYSALGFGIIEVILRWISNGQIFFSITPLAHVLFSLPTAYAHKSSPRAYPIGLAISIIFHALWNFIVVSV